MKVTARVEKNEPSRDWGIMIVYYNREVELQIGFLFWYIVIDFDF